MRIHIRFVLELLALITTIIGGVYVFNNNNRLEAMFAWATVCILWGSSLSCFDKK